MLLQIGAAIANKGNRYYIIGQLLGKVYYNSNNKPEYIAIPLEIN